MWKHSRSTQKSTPTYFVEHLATFRVGPQFGIQWPEDGIKKLKEMEKTSDVWAQKLNLKLFQDCIILEDENGELVEKFPRNLVSEPYAYASGFANTSTLKRGGDSDNLLILKVTEPEKSSLNNGRSENDAGYPAEMHIFRCPRHSANEVSAAINKFLTGSEVPSKKEPPQEKATFIPVSLLAEPARPSWGSYMQGGPPASQQNNWAHRSGRRYKSEGFSSLADPQLRTRRISGEVPAGMLPKQHGGAARTAGVTSGQMSRSYSDYPIGTAFDSDVNTLNCYIDDVERFVARVQSAMAAQRDLDHLRQQREATLARARQSRHGSPLYLTPPSAHEGALQSRAVLPAEPEYVDVLTKFKYCFNMLGKLQPHIQDPDAPQLARYLFSPLVVILDAARWSLNKDLAPQITYPPVTRDAHSLLSQCLSQREYDIWMSLGDAWKNPSESFTSTISRRPADSTLSRNKRGPLHHGYSTSDVDRLRSLDEVEAEALHLAEKERLLKHKEAALDRLEKRLNQDRESLKDAFERISLDQPHPRDTANVTLAGRDTSHRRSRSSQRPGYSQPTNFTKQKNYFDQLKQTCPHKIAAITHDRIGQNDKELTVSTGDYLEVLNDSRNWWHCRDANGAVGFVPNTIVSRVHLDQEFSGVNSDMTRLQQPISVNVPAPNVQPLNFDQSESRRFKDQGYPDRGHTSSRFNDRTLTFNGNLL